MCKIISFEKHWDKKQRNKESTKTIEFYEYNENINAFLGYTATEISNIPDKPGIEKLIEMEKEDRKKFEERYSDVLTTAPFTNEGKIQYFAGIMLNFLPMIFHGQWKDSFNAFIDFSEFYLSEFDTAYTQYCSEYQEYEKEYSFRFIPLDTAALENEMHDCLTQLICLSATKNCREKAEGIMWQACRLFELYHNMADLFSEKFEKRK